MYVCKFMYICIFLCLISLCWVQSSFDVSPGRWSPGAAATRRGLAATTWPRSAKKHRRNREIEDIEWFSKFLLSYFFIIFIFYSIFLFFQILFQMYSLKNTRRFLCLPKLRTPGGKLNARRRNMFRSAALLDSLQFASSRISGSGKQTCEIFLCPKCEIFCTSNMRKLPGSQNSILDISKMTWDEVIKRASDTSGESNFYTNKCVVILHFVCSGAQIRTERCRVTCWSVGVIESVEKLSSQPLRALHVAWPDITNWVSIFVLKFMFKLWQNIERSSSFMSITQFFFIFFTIFLRFHVFSSIFYS